MGKRRTRKQKLKTKKVKVVKVSKKQEAEQAVDVEKKTLILKDLRKTMMVGLILLGLLIGIYFYLS